MEKDSFMWISLAVASVGFLLWEAFNAQRFNDFQQLVSSGRYKILMSSPLSNDPIIKLAWSSMRIPQKLCACSLVLLFLLSGVVLGDGHDAALLPQRWAGGEPESSSGCRLGSHCLGRRGGSHQGSGELGFGKGAGFGIISGGGGFAGGGGGGGGGGVGSGYGSGFGFGGATLGGGRGAGGGGGGSGGGGGH